MLSADWGAKQPQKDLEAKDVPRPSQQPRHGYVSPPAGYSFPLVPAPLSLGKGILTFAHAAVSGHGVASITGHAGVGALGVEAESGGTGSPGCALVDVCVSTQGRARWVGRIRRNHDQGQLS